MSAHTRSQPFLFPLTLIVYAAFAACRTAAWAEVVINEIDPDQIGADDAEFIELYDGGQGNVPLDGLYLTLVNGSSDKIYRVIDLQGQATNSQGFFLVANPKITGAHLIIEPGKSGAIQNGPDAVALYRSPLAAPIKGETPPTQGLVDAVVYGSNDADDTDLLTLLTPGQAQLNDEPEKSLSRLPDGGSPLLASAFQPQDPTPGLPNVARGELSLTFSLTEVSESAGANALEGKVTREGLLEREIEVALSGNDISEIRVPPSIVFPAGETSASFHATPQDDFWPDGSQEVEIVAEAPGFLNAAATLLVLDDAADPLTLAVNEVYPVDREDANGDGEGPDDGPGKDEFVELVNPLETPLDLSGWELHDAVALRHRFPSGTLLAPGCAIVIFGGGDFVEGRHARFGGALVQGANQANAYGLGLNNGGDLIRILNPDGVEMAGFAYTDEAPTGRAAAWVRIPELYGPIVSHLDAETGATPYAFTPGFTAAGEPFCSIAQALQVDADVLRVLENAGDEAGTLTISRSGPTDRALTLTLQSSDLSELQLPLSVVMAAGESSVRVPLNAVDDPVDDGEIEVAITVSAPDYVGATLNVIVVDEGDPPPMIVINELDADQPGEENSEFVELYDGGQGQTPLDGLVLVLFNGATSASYAVYSLDGWTTDPTGFFVLGDVETPGVHLGLPEFTLQNGPDAVALYRGRVDHFPARSYPVEEGLIDALVYETNDEAGTDLVTALTPDQPRVDEGATDNTVSIGRWPDGGAFRHTADHARLQPTPGGPNTLAPKSRFAAWAEAQGVAGKTGDLDGDGLSTLYEYLIGTEPLSFDEGQLHPFLEPLDGEHAVLTLPRKGSWPPDLEVRYLHSHDLQTWTPVEPVEMEQGDKFFRLAFSDALTRAGPSFMRLELTLQR